MGYLFVLLMNACKEVKSKYSIVQRGGGGQKWQFAPGPRIKGAPKNIMEKNKRYYQTAVEFR